MKNLFVILFAAVISCGFAAQDAKVVVTPTPSGGGAAAVVVSPSNPELEVNGTVQFTASVSSTWSIQEGTSGGTISSSGVYTAPSTVGSYHIVATPTGTTGSTLTVDTSTASSALKQGGTAVRVRKTQISIAPTTASVPGGATKQFTATVTGASDTSSTWSVQEGAAGGSVDATGLYTAPLVVGSYHVIATSNASPLKTAIATVTVTTPTQVSINISPASGSVDACQTFPFGTMIAGTGDMRVTWSVVEVGGGTVSTAGVYTAPATGGTYHVTVTSVADPTKSSTATLTVTERIVSVVVSPNAPTVVPLGTQQFVATVTTTCGAFQTPLL